MKKNTIQKTVAAPAPQSAQTPARQTQDEDDPWYPDIAVSDRPTRDMRAPAAPAAVETP